MKNEFTKIKLVPKKNDCPPRTILSWQIKREDDSYDTFTLESKDEPAPSFLLRFLELREFVNDICDLRLADDELHKLSILSVSLSYASEKHILGATITALKTLPNRNAPLVINTPHLIEDYYSDSGDPASLLPQDLVTLIYEIQEEADDFVKGFRMQMNLFPIEK